MSLTDWMNRTWDAGESWLRPFLTRLSGGRVPVAWLNLLHLRWRLFVHVGGIVFAVVLMFMEFGFWLALLRSQVTVIEHMPADLIIVNKAQYTITVANPFPRERLDQALAVDGVAETRALYMENVTSIWNNGSQTNQFSDEAALRMIRVLAFDPVKPALDFPEVAALSDELKLPSTVLMDTQSKPIYDPQNRNRFHELTRKRVNVAGSFTLGCDFVHEGTVITSDRTFASIFPRANPAESALNWVEVGLVKLKPGADTERVLAGLRAALPDDVEVSTRWDYVLKEVWFWQVATPMGIIFLGGAIMGFVVGMIICYHVLYTNVSDNLPEYATLKAVGYSNSSLTGIVVQESLIMALFGFVPGIAVSLILYVFLAWVTALPLGLRLDIGGLVLVLTVAMCLLAGYLASWRLRAADPAAVF